MNNITCDKTLCTGCLACVVACMDQHYDENEEAAVSPRIYEKYVSEKSGMMCYKTRSCLHCKAAECIKVCKSGALYKDDAGFVRVERALCTGCHACEKACPFHVPQFDRENKIVKCDGCAVRVSHGLLPACVSACPTGALKMQKS